MALNAKKYLLLMLLKSKSLNHTADERFWVLTKLDRLQSQTKVTDMSAL